MRVKTTLAAMAAASVLLLSGCSFGDVVKTTTGGQVEVSEGKVSAGGTTVDTTGGSLPKDWPSELPTPNGKLISSVSTDGTFMLNYTIPDDTAVTDLVAKLTSAGYTASSDFSSDDAGMNTLSNGTRQVSLMWGTTDGERTLTYMVTPAE